MSVYQNSRYVGRKVFKFDDPLTQEKVELMDRLVFRGDVLGSNFETHVVEAHDRIDILAWRYLGNARWWWIIALANDLFWPLDLEVGTVLNIPDPEEFFAVVYPKLRAGREQ